MLDELLSEINAQAIGLLVIDQVERLISSPEFPDCMTFFQLLTEETHTSVLLLSTPALLPHASSSFQSASLLDTSGTILWLPMEEDSLFQHFLQELFPFQHLRKPAALTDELTSIFYQETQGIQAFIIRLFEIVQMLALLNGKESFTAKDVHLAAEDFFPGTKPILQALQCCRSHKPPDYSSIQIYSDLAPIYVKETNTHPSPLFATPMSQAQQLADLRYLLVHNLSLPPAEAEKYLQKALHTYGSLLPEKEIILRDILNAKHDADHSQDQKLQLSSLGKESD